jgi:tRNA(Ile)-lysidine synthase
MGGAPARFAAEVVRLAGPAFAPGTPVALAVSGGADSRALLWLAAKTLPAARVLSVNHGLRAAAAAECAEVAALSAELGLPHATLQVKLAPGGDVQARAREARYAAMAGWCRAHGIGLLLTAHQADDQAETFLMRSARGSGLAGLAGIRERTELQGITVIRPLLGWRRAELAGLVRAAGWSAVEDPSNADPRFDRVRMRVLLAREPALAPDRLAATAAHLAEAEYALDWAAARAFETRSEIGPMGLLLDPEALPAELQRRLLARGLAMLGAAPDGPALARLLARLLAGGQGTLGGVRVQGRPDGRWRLSAAPPRRR